MSANRILSLIALSTILGLVGCSAQEVIVITATPMPATNTPDVSATPEPTATNEPEPTQTPEPTTPPVSIGDLESALRDHGYSRHPFETEEDTGFTWIKEHAFEQVTTWNYGAIELEVLHDDSQRTRSNHMEQKFEVLDDVFPSDFMSELRREFESYNDRVRTDISGEPEEVYSLGGDFQDVWAQYYVEDMEIDGYLVSFSVWWWQSTCPDGYICWYPNFPGLEFEGDSSFKFLTVYIEPTSDNPLGGSA